MKRNFKRVVGTAKSLRRKSTDAEKHLWNRLKAKQLAGWKFRRQQPLGKFIVDFVSFEKLIVIELDGGQHSIEKEKDIERDKWLNKEGFKVLRFWDNEVLTNIEGVMEVIRGNCLSPSPSSPPLKGGET